MAAAVSFESGAPFGAHDQPPDGRWRLSMYRTARVSLLGRASTAQIVELTSVPILPSFRRCRRSRVRKGSGLSRTARSAMTRRARSVVSATGASRRYTTVPFGGRPAAFRPRTAQAVSAESERAPGSANPPSACWRDAT